MAFAARVVSSFLTVGNNYEFIKDGADAFALQLTPRETVTLVFNFDAAGTTDDIEIEILQGHRESSGNTFDSVTDASNLELDTAADGFTNDDDMNGLFITITDAAAAERGEGKLITDSAAVDDGVVLATALSSAPSAAESYDLWRLSAVWNFIMNTFTPTDDIPHNGRVTVDAADGEWVLVRARRDGVTDAHRVRFSYQRDGVSV